MKIISKRLKVFVGVWLFLLVLTGVYVIAQDEGSDPPTTTGDTGLVDPPGLQHQSHVDLSQCSKNVGLLGIGFVAAITTFLQNNGQNVVTVNQAFIDAGNLSTLDVLYLGRGGTGVANANVAAIQAFVQNGGTLITEFSATDAVINNFNFCTGTLDNPFKVPSGTVCGGNDVTVQNPSNPIATGLGAGWSCSGDPIGVIRTFNPLDAAFDIVATVGPDPVVATCCQGTGSGVWVAFFTDFGDWQSLQDPRTCPNPPCNRSQEDEALMLNSVCLARNACAQVEVEKDYRFTNVCFERDNDLDGLFNEDPVDFDAAGNPIDNDGDGLFNEDDVDCEDFDGDGLPDTDLGTQLPIDPGSGKFLLEAVVKKNGKVSSYNPGQYYAVSTITPLTDLDTLWISERYGECTDPAVGDPLSALNPKMGTGGGNVVIVDVDENGVAFQIADSNSPNVFITDDNGNGIPDNAEAHLTNVPADHTILMYVKFKPGLKGNPIPADPDNMCENENAAQTEVDGPEVSATASLIVLPK